MDDIKAKSTQINEQDHPTFGEAARYWIKLGFMSFGGPAGQIAMMQTECVDRRGWISQGAFLRGLNYSMLLPGPEAQQLAAYIGWRLHGIKGALFAGTAFIVPGAILMIALAWIAAAYGGEGAVAAVFEGIKPVVVAIVIAAVYRIGKRTCKGPVPLILAFAAFAALQFTHTPFPLIILIAGLAGIMIAKVMPHALTMGHGEHTVESVTHTRASDQSATKRFVIITTVFLLALTIPSVLTVVIFGTAPFINVLKLFISAAFVTFGGAYAVLPYVANAGVNVYGWLSGADMINGLALAETTPGPLILVTTYVGFFAGWSNGGLSTAIISAVLTTYVTFLPSFYLIIAGAPYVESVQRFAWARNALSAITAAVVGVILNLAIFLGRAAFFDQSGNVHWISMAAAAISLALLISNKLSIPMLVAIGAAFGLVRIWI
ncbi:MAG: chromate efflux transporter [Rhodospirillales bacterium]|nr:chromate efflux transporter [Rhodospirillales bacterium]